MRYIKKSRGREVFNFPRVPPPFNFTLLMQVPVSSRQPAPLEIGGRAVWSLSSSKPGFGISQLRDDSTDTYWQYVNWAGGRYAAYVGGIYWNTLLPQV